jgi:hypothetical protein
MIYLLGHKRTEAYARAMSGAGTSKQVAGDLLPVEPEDAVARPDAAVYLYCNLLPRIHLFHRFVLDLHGSDYLAEIGSTAENVQDVAQTDGCREVEDCNAQPAIVMGHTTNELVGHGCLLLVASKIPI